MFADQYNNTDISENLYLLLNDVISEVTTERGLAMHVFQRNTTTVSGHWDYINAVYFAGTVITTVGKSI